MCSILEKDLLNQAQWAKSLKKTEGVRFCKFGTQNTVPYCQRYTPTYCFFGDFAHWENKNVSLTLLSNIP